VLPKYFTHSNFASFVRCARCARARAVASGASANEKGPRPGRRVILTWHAPARRRQLNNYGFRKASSAAGRHEFGAPGFRRGCPELLRTLKRLDTARAPKKGSAAADDAQQPQQQQRHPAGDADGEPVHAQRQLQSGVLRDDVAALKRDRAALQRELRTLREGAAQTQACVRALSARLASTEAAQAQMLRWGAAAVHALPGGDGGGSSSGARRGVRARQVSREGGALALAALSEAAANAAHDSRGRGFAAGIAATVGIAQGRLADAQAAAAAAAAAAEAAEEDAAPKRARADQLAQGDDDAATTT